MSFTPVARALALIPLTLLVLPERAGAEPSPWVQGQHARARLVPGGPDGGARLVGLALRLDPGFKTYWRHPGESGLPPSFDWSGSTNLKGAEVLWPAPTRFEDGGGVAYGYKGEVVLPLRVVPADPTRPLALRLALAYGVCDSICVPERADLALNAEAEPADPAVREALARVPARQELGSGGEVAILGPTPGPRPQTFAVAVRAPPGSDPRLFVEAPEGWFALAGAQAGPPSPGAPAGATASFAAEMLERPAGASGPVELRLTLVAGARAVESPATLDTPAGPR